MNYYYYMLFFVSFPTFILHILSNANTEHGHLDHQNTTAVVDRWTGVRLPLVRMRRGGRRRHLAAGVSDFGMDVQFGFGEYYVTLGVGTPPTNQTLVMDTGSDLTWIQCLDCDRCFLQPDPIFDPSKSDSINWVPCNSDTCNNLGNVAAVYECVQNQCRYKYSYAGGTCTMGSLASETLTIGGTTVPNVLMGCANNNSISFQDEAADGILGLGWGSLSLVMNQSSGLVGDAFTFCLSSNGSNGGWLTFGRSRGSPHEATKWALLIKNSEYPSYYYINVLRLEVDGTTVDNIPGDTFQINPEMGSGGVIIDTGTTITQLPEVAYNALRDHFNARLDKSFTPTTSASPHYDTCYTIGSENDVKLPRVSFIIQDMYNFTLFIEINATNVLVKDLVGSIACFAFARATALTTTAIIGNQQLQGIPISIDASAGYVGFGSSNAC